MNVFANIIPDEWPAMMKQTEKGRCMILEDKKVAVDSARNGRICYKVGGTNVSFCLDQAKDKQYKDMLLTQVNINFGNT